MSHSAPDHQRPAKLDPATMTEAEYRDYMADPHAFHPEHHGPGQHAHDGEGHHVTSLFLLRAVLAALVFFTLLTVAASRFEIWVAEVFQIEIPTLVNVFVAMSIATIKAILVVGVFMHLKWDNRLNLMVFLFTLMGVGLFIGLSALDLGNRQEFYDWKAKPIQLGGTGGLTRGKDETINTSMVEYARQKAIQKYGEAEFARKAAEKHPHHEHHEPLRSADRTRPIQGPTPGLFDAVPPGQDHHGHAPEAAGHAGQAGADGHAQPDPPH